MYADHNQLLALAILMPVLGFIAVALRFYTRFVKKAPLLADDWLIVPAEIILIAMSALTIVGIHGKALGYAIPGETEAEAINGEPPVQILATKMDFAILMIDSLQLMFAKLSIIFFYRRIFCGTKGTSLMSIATWILIGLTIIWGTSFFFSNLFECQTNWPANWGASSTLATKCINEVAMNEAYMDSDFVLDFLIFILPIYKVWTLQMSVGRRLAVIGILSLGALTIVASAIKVGIMVELAQVVQSGFTSADKLLSTDPDLLQSIMIYWVLLEGGVATIVACLPTLNSLIHGTPNLLRSLRSMLSVNSLRSTGDRSQRSHKSVTRLGSSDHHSQSSQAEINKLEALEAGMGSQAYAMKDLEQRGHLNQKGITVKNYVTQDSSEHV